MEGGQNVERVLKAVEEIKRQEEIIKLGGGADKIEAHHKARMLTARERIEAFFDPGTFVELDMFAHSLGRDFGADKVYAPSDGVIIGYGKVDERDVAIFAQDFTCAGGSWGEMHGRKICKINDMAVKWGMPMVGFHNSGGARLQEFINASGQYGEWFYRTSIYSGVIPQIAAMMGMVAGGQTYQPGLCDFILMTKDSAAFIAGPPLVKSVLGEDISAEALGGTAMHSTVSGVCHVVAEDDLDCIDRVKELLSYLPSNNREKPPRLETGDDPERLCEELYEIVPPNVETPFDMHNVIYEIVDNKSAFCEIHRDYATSMIVGFARFNGHSTGIIANNPMYMAGSVTCKAAEKAARFIRCCDAFSIPLLYLTATPAYLVGSEQEREGMIYRGATLLYATSEATVPIVNVIVSWAYAGAYLAMGSKYLRADYVCAFPTAEVGAVAAPGVVDVVRRKEIKEAENPTEARNRFIQEFKDTYMKITYPASYQHIDAIIDPKETRATIIKVMDRLRNKKEELPWRKHGNMPL